jgi:hypothetical protein
MSLKIKKEDVIFSTFVALPREEEEKQKELRDASPKKKVLTPIPTSATKAKR